MSRLCLTIGIIFFGLCLSTQVWSFGLAPAVIELSGERDGVIESRFTLVNDEGQEKTFYFETIKFEAKDESGSPEFIPYKEDHEGLPEWIKFENKSLIVPAKSFVEVPFIITIPSSIQSGGYYAAITVSDSRPPTEATAPTIQNKTAILIFLNIKGENIEKATLLDFQTSKIIVENAGTFTYKIENQGNVYLKPTGMIVLKDIFGRILAEVDANPEGSRVLNNTIRKIEADFSGKPTIGPVTAELNIKYGEQNQELTNSLVFWVLPWKILSTVVGIVVILITGLIALAKNKK